MTFLEIYSNAMQLATHTAITSSARMPKISTPAIPAGISEIITSPIIPVTVFGLFMCGEELIVSFFVNSVILCLPPS